METFLSQKSPKIFSCIPCDYNTSNKKDFSKHLLTRKHQKETNGNNKIPTTECDFCKRQFTSRSGLWKHEKKCMMRNIKSENKKSSDKLIINDTSKEVHNKKVDDIISQNKKLQELIIKQNERLEMQTNQIENQQIMLENIKEKQENVIINNTQNNININIFLNEKCKNAINFAKFIENIEVTKKDLEYNAQMGFVNGISKILVDNLKQLTLYERPIHCADIKKEILYIKDDDKWSVENDDNKLRNAIQEVSRKSLHSLIKWKKTNPEYENIDSEFSSKCVSMQKNSMSIYDHVKYTKVIHNVVKENVIDYE